MTLQQYKQKFADDLHGMSETEIILCYEAYCVGLTESEIERYEYERIG